MLITAITCLICCPLTAQGPEPARTSTSGESIARDLPPAGTELGLALDFQQSAAHPPARLELTDPAAWRIRNEAGRSFLDLHRKQSEYRPPHRSPLHWAIVEEFTAGDFVLDVDLRTTHEDYGHRDLCIAFGWQDPAHFYYAHLGQEADGSSHTILVVDGADRAPIVEERTDGIPWDEKWHRVRVVRELESGAIRVYFDDFEHPVLSAHDRRFGEGRIALGSFDDTGNFDALRVWTPATSPGAAPAGVGRSAELTRFAVTEHFCLHARPGSRAAAALDRVAWMIEDEYEALLTRMEWHGHVDERAPFHLFLYDDVDDLLHTTGTSGNAGFSTARESHIPWDNDQTRQHELVHIVAAAVPPTGEDSRNMFLVEGIANAFLRFVHGVPVHSVAAYELDRDSLPALSTLLSGDFYTYLSRNPGFNGYDIGGSFVLFLLDTHGASATSQYYFGRTVFSAFGCPLEELELEWRTFLQAQELRPELRELLGERRGDGGDFANATAGPALDSSILEPAQAWTPILAELELDRTEGGGQWARGGDGTSGETSSGADWSIVRTPTAAKDTIVHAEFTAGESCWGVQVRIGKAVQAMLLGQGTFLYAEDQHGVAFSDRWKLVPGERYELFLRLRDRRAELWVNGEYRLQAENLQGESGFVGVGVVGGSVEFTELRMRTPSD